jgi:hypothetical protein
VGLFLPRFARDASLGSADQGVAGLSQGRPREDPEKVSSQQMPANHVPFLSLTTGLPAAGCGELPATICGESRLSASTKQEVTPHTLAETHRPVRAWMAVKALNGQMVVGPPLG